MPSPHSSSSHSSSSRSSSSHSRSSHSSSSHSSSSRCSSSRSPSPHSSSSHSSSYSSSSRSGSFHSSRSSGSSQSRSVPYSSPSHTEYERFQGKRSAYVKDGSMRGRVIPRERNHQPTGYSKYSNRGAPSTHYGRKHNYVYYPADWTDSASGTSYRKGYYDENGAYYPQVVFRRDGVYKDVPCTCEFCGVTAMYTFSSGEALMCRQCGAPLRIEAILDEYTQDPEYTAYETRYPASKIKYSGADGTGKGAKRGFLAAFFGVILLLLLLPSLTGSCGNGRTRDDTLYALPAEPMVYEEPVKTNPEIFGDPLYLDQTEAGYILSPDGGESWDRKLTWDYGENSYYDKQAECWVWYNTEVSPNLWQYWYEGISSEYGEFGWMEYEPEGWFIQVGVEKWAPLPKNFVSERLWHMEIDPDLYGS